MASRQRDGASCRRQRPPGRPKVTVAGAAAADPRCQQVPVESLKIDRSSRRGWPFLEADALVGPEEVQVSFEPAQARAAI